MNSYCIIGLGRFGTVLAATLAEAGKNVLVIDNKEENVNAIADTVSTAILGDATQESVLRAAGVADYDCAVVAMSENMGDSILAVLLLKELGVPYVVARAGSERHATVLRKLGIQEIIQPESEIGRKFGRQLAFDGLLQYMECSENTVLAEIEVPQKWIGKNLITLDLRNKMEIHVISVRKKGKDQKSIFADPKQAFEAGDCVTLVGTTEDVNRLIAYRK